VTPLVAAAVLFAAVTHASWNAIAHQITDKLVGFTRRRAGRPRTLTGVALWGLRGSRPDWAALGAALATGLTIASYTVVDGLGARAAGSSLGYISWLMAVQGGVIPVYALTRRRGQFHLAI
jgi:hypothetical protein